MSAYRVVKIDDKKYIIVRHDDVPPYRPEGGRVYPHGTSAYRECRRLNKSAENIDAMIKRDGAIIL